MGAPRNKNMKLMRTLIATAMLVGTLIASAGSLRSDMQTSMNSYCKMIMARNHSGMMKYVNNTFSPDFMYTPLHGEKENREAWVKHMVEEDKMMAKVTMMKLTITKLTEKGDMATGMVTVGYGGVTKAPKGKKADTFKYTGTCSMKMMKMDGKWWVTEIKEITGKAMMNGKEMKV